MSQFFDYSKYYNLLYKDKDYSIEVDYVESLIKRFHPRAKTILDIGCGTGIHASLLVDRGYTVHGMDLSDEMLKSANQKSKSDLTFSQGDIQNFSINKKFDVITSLFHVMSYQTSNGAVASSFKSVFEHLSDEGVFIFDCWYGPAVLLDLPTVKIKRMEDERLKVLRISEPVMDINRSTVEVKFEVNVFEKETNERQTVSEKHLMRYFFQNELYLFAEAAGLQIANIYTWLSDVEPKDSSWYITVVCSKIK
jgi:SAM-dependent methyltransferase